MVFLKFSHCFPINLQQFSWSGGPKRWTNLSSEAGSDVIYSIYIYTHLDVCNTAWTPYNWVQVIIVIVETSKLFLQLVGINNFHPKELIWHRVSNLLVIWKHRQQALVCAFHVESVGLWQIVLPQSSGFLRFVSNNHNSRRIFLSNMCPFLVAVGNLLRLTVFKVRSRFLLGGNYGWTERTPQRPVPLSNFQKGMGLCSCLLPYKMVKFLGTIKSSPPQKKYI